MTTYKMLNLNQVIEALFAMPEGSVVIGLDGDLHSDRGYYDRSATAHNSTERDAHELADQLNRQIGKEIHGWKGGDYQVNGNLPLYLAEYGDVGPAIIGFVADPNSGVYEPVLLNESWY